MLADYIAVIHGEHLCLTFEQVNSDYKQGVFLQLSGIIELNNNRYKRGLLLWLGDAKVENTIRIDLKSKVRHKYLKRGELKIQNTWDSGNGMCHFGHNGSAMYKEEIPNGFRYFCNDGEPDDDFDDLIFRIERLGVQPEES